MQTNSLLPKAEKTSLKRLLLPVVVLALLVAIYYLGLKWVAPDGSDLIFHQTKGGWQQLPGAKGYPETLRVSSGGAVWLCTLGGGLSRWDGATWHRESDFGGKTGYIYGGLALDGEEVWAPTEEGVLHWNGQRWQSYPEGSLSRGASIVAAGGQAWVIDSSGKFSHFEGGRWQSHQLAAPGLSWTEKQHGWGPQLARSADGALWLGRRGIWRFDGASWAAVTAGTDDLKDAELLGAAGDRLWISDSSGLRSVSTDGRNWTLYPPAQTGLTEEGWVQDIASAGGRTWFATDTGLVEFDGSLWRPLALPVHGVAGIRRVAAGTDGSLWVIGSPPRPSSWSMRYGIYFRLLMPLLGIVGVIVWISRLLAQRRLQEHQRVTQAVQHATGDVPAELEQGEQRLAQSYSWRGRILVAALYLGGLAAYVVIPLVRPNARLWPIPVVVVAIHLAGILRESLVKRKAKPSDPIGPGAPSSYDWGKTWKALAGGLLLLALYNVDRIPGLKFLQGYSWILLLAWIVCANLIQNLMNRALRRGDYDGALKIVRWVHFYNPSGPEPLRMSGHFLLAAGRYREAEDTLRRSMTSSHASKSYALALEYLGDVLMEQGRYDEATRSYEAALHAFSWVRRPYRGMAEMLLRQGKNPEQALEYVERIVDFAGLSWYERQLNGHAQDDYWALKAWALARLGRSPEVGKAIENALKATNKTSSLDLATTHYRAGMAMQALGNQSSANEHFNRAVGLDPVGRRGALARAALRESSVLGGVRG